MAGCEVPDGAPRELPAAADDADAADAGEPWLGVEWGPK
jgi:hypothetical protein